MWRWPPEVMLITGQLGTTTALFLLIGVFSILIPEGTVRGYS